MSNAELIQWVRAFIRGSNKQEVIEKLTKVAAALEQAETVNAALATRLEEKSAAFDHLAAEIEALTKQRDEQKRIADGQILAANALSRRFTDAEAQIVALTKANDRAREIMVEYQADIEEKSAAFDHLAAERDRATTLAQKLYNEKIAEQDRLSRLALIAEGKSMNAEQRIEGALLDLNDLCSTLQLGGLYTEKIDTQIRRIQARLAGTDDEGDYTKARGVAPIGARAMIAKVYGISRNLDLGSGRG